MKDLFFFTFHPRRDHWWVPSIPPWSLASQSRPSWWSTGHPWAWQRSLWGDEHIPKLPWCHGWSRARRSPAGDHPCQSPPCWLGISLRRWFGCTQRLRECLPSGFEEGSTYKGLCMRRTKQLVGRKKERKGKRRCTKGLTSLMRRSSCSFMAAMKSEERRRRRRRRRRR